MVSPSSRTRLWTDAQLTCDAFHPRHFKNIFGSDCTLRIIIHLDDYLYSSTCKSLPPVPNPMWTAIRSTKWLWWLAVRLATPTTMTIMSWTMTSLTMVCRLVPLYKRCRRLTRRDRYRTRWAIGPVWQSTLNRQHSILLVSATPGPELLDIPNTRRRSEGGPEHDWRECVGHSVKRSLRSMGENETSLVAEISSWRYASAERRWYSRRGESGLWKRYQRLSRKMARHRRDLTRCHEWRFKRLGSVVSKADTRQYRLLTRLYRGPLIFCLLLSLFLSMRASSDQKDLVFSGVFTLIWIGEAVVAIQIKLLGGNM